MKAIDPSTEQMLQSRRLSPSPAPLPAPPGPLAPWVPGLFRALQGLLGLGGNWRAAGWVADFQWAPRQHTSPSLQSDSKVPPQLNGSLQVSRKRKPVCKDLGRDCTTSNYQPAKGQRRYPVAFPEPKLSAIRPPKTGWYRLHRFGEPPESSLES